MRQGLVPVILLVAVIAFAPATLGCRGSVTQQSPPDGPDPVADVASPPTIDAARDSHADTTHCGDGQCVGGEHCASCPSDCGSCVPEVLRFSAVADSYVDAGKPDSNYGAAQLLYTDQSPDQHGLLRFVVAGLKGRGIASARLRLHVANASSDGPRVFTTSAAWDEGTVTWANKPQPSASPTADFAGIAQGWVEIDVSKAISADGAVSFVLVPTSSDGADFSSRESAHAPELVLRTEVAHPAPPDAGGPIPDGGLTSRFTFFVLGDTRSNPSIAQRNFQSIAMLDPQAIALFNSGDITADGKVSQWQNHEQAVNLGGGGVIRMDLEQFTPGSIRYFGVLGNHDVHTTGWRTNWNTFLSGQRKLGHNEQNGVWFSFVYRNALFLLLDSEHTSSAQTTWLENELAAAAANPAIKWRFAFFHKPIYPCNYKSPFSGGVPWARKFESYGVDMVFTGHAHLYERTCPMVGGKCQPGGVIYVTSGGGGAGTVKLMKAKSANAGGDVYNCSDILQVGKGYWHHYCHLSIDGGKLDYRCFPHDQTQNPEDTLTLTK
jgi:hypothetical protein